MKNEINICSIKRESIVDGYGFRYVIFTQGCKHHCKGCFNPDTHSFDTKKLVDTNELLKEIKDNHMIDGVTLSGGDPFEQSKNLIDFVQKIKKENLTIWAYTGYTFEELLIDFEKYRLLKEIDILVDGKFDINLKDETLVFRGSRNQRVIDVQKALQHNQIVLFK